MLKSLFALFLIFVFTTVQASAAPGNPIKAAFDDFNYSIKVEWDQQDSEFYETQVSKFESRIQAILNDGATPLQVVEQALAQVKDKKLAESIKGTLALTKDGVVSEAEALTMILDAAKNTQMEGASWSSSNTALYVGLGLAITGFVVFAAFLASKITPYCSEEPNDPNCIPN